MFQVRCLYFIVILSCIGGRPGLTFCSVLLPFILSDFVCSGSHIYPADVARRAAAAQIYNLMLRQIPADGFKCFEKGRNK